MPSVNSSSSVADVRVSRDLRSQPGACVHQFVAQRAAENPNAVAVSNRYEDLTYAELDRRSNGLSNQLRSMGVDPNVLVGLYLDRSSRDGRGRAGDSQSRRGVSAAGSDHPVERLAFMLRGLKQNCRHQSETFGRVDFLARVASHHVDGDAEKIAASQTPRRKAASAPMTWPTLFIPPARPGSPRAWNDSRRAVESGGLASARFSGDAGDRASAQSDLGI